MSDLLSFSLEDDAPIKSIGQIKDEFYPVVTLLKKEVKKPYRSDPRKRIVKPQVLVLNPPGYGNPDSITHSDVYVAVYYRGYYVRIEHGQSIFGPHKFELYYQVKPGQRVWLGTTTFKCDFFSEKKLLKMLRLAIMRKEYYCSPTSAEDIVEFPHHSDAIQVKETRL